MNIRTHVGDQTSHIAAIVAEFRDVDGALLPILHRVQEELGYVPDMAKQLIAGALNLSRAEVHGVVSFYPDFRSERCGEHVIKLCRAEACQAMGCERLGDQVKQRFNVDWHETSVDQRVTLEPVFCLGLCAQAPAAMIDDELYARLNEHCLSDLLEEVCR